MAYDEDLAERIRAVLAGEPDVTERKMFGGLAFLVGGHMSITASGEGGVLIRVDPDTADELVASTEAEAAVMRGRSMKGWLRVSSADLRTEGRLDAWVERTITYARCLPPKKRDAR